MHTPHPHVTKSLPFQEHPGQQSQEILVAKSTYLISFEGIIFITCLKKTTFFQWVKDEK